MSQVSGQRAGGDGAVAEPGMSPEAKLRPIGADEFRAVMASFAASVTVITTVDEAGAPHALTATAFSSVSKHPPLCLVCVDERARAHAVIRRTQRFAVNILRGDQSELSARFATSLEDKFAGVAWLAGGATGCPLLPGALATLECRLFAEYPGGDHEIFIGEILSANADPSGDPLVYFRGQYAELSPKTVG